MLFRCLYEFLSTCLPLSLPAAPLYLVLSYLLTFLYFSTTQLFCRPKFIRAIKKKILADNRQLISFTNNWFFSNPRFFHNFYSYLFKFLRYMEIYPFFIGAEGSRIPHWAPEGLHQSQTDSSQPGQGTPGHQDQGIGQFCKDDQKYS